LDGFDEPGLSNACLSWDVHHQLLVGGRDSKELQIIWMD
jgi:hypothetical protein